MLCVLFFLKWGTVLSSALTIAIRKQSYDNVLHSVDTVIIHVLTNFLNITNLAVINFFSGTLTDSAVQLDGTTDSDSSAGRHHRQL